MPHLKTLFSFEGTAELLLADTVDYKDELWLVPYWIDNLPTGRKSPERIVLLASIPHQKSDGMDYHFALSAPVPKAVFRGQPYAQTEIQYVVEERPPLNFPLAD